MKKDIGCLALLVEKAFVIVGLFTGVTAGLRHVLDEASVENNGALTLCVACFAIACYVRLTGEED